MAAWRGASAWAVANAWRRPAASIAYRRRFVTGYTTDYYTGRRNMPETASWYKGIFGPANMGAALCYALGATSYDEVRKTLGIDDGECRAMPDNTSAREQAATIRASATRRPRLVFDIGCGRGEIAATLAHLGIRAVAVDPSAAAGGLVRETAGRFYGIPQGGVEFVQATGLAALREYQEKPDTAIFCESIEHIPTDELYKTFEWMRRNAPPDVGMRAVITNWPDFHPIRAEPGDWDHVHGVDDELYDRLASMARSTVVRHGSHLVLDF